MEYALAALVLVLWCDYVWYVEGFGAGAFAVAEDVVLCYGEACHELVCLVEELLGFASGADDGVDADEGVGDALEDVLYFGAKECCVVAAVHELEYLVAAALQWYMEVWHEGSALGAEPDDVWCEEVGFDAGDAVALYALDLIECLEEIEEGFACGASEVADVDAGDDYLFGALVGGVGGLLYHGGYAAVAAASAGYGYGAVCAVVVAAVLYFEEVACAVAAGA